jgi:hypothetical protein
MTFGGGASMAQITHTAPQSDVTSHNHYMAYQGAHYFGFYPVRSGHSFTFCHGALSCKKWAKISSPLFQKVMVLRGANWMG